MIAANFRKFSEAMALQFPLPLTRMVWATSRPTTRILRAIRAARGAAFKLAGLVRYPEKRSMPAWVKVARAKARKLAKMVREAQQVLGFVVPAAKKGYAAHVERIRALQAAPRCPIVLSVLGT